MTLEQTISAIRPLDEKSMTAARNRFANIAMPLGGLGLLQEDVYKRQVLEVRELLRQRGELGSAALIERVGMDGQRLIEDLDERCV